MSCLKGLDVTDEELFCQGLEFQASAFHWADHSDVGTLLVII